MTRHLLVVTTLLLTPFAATHAADSPAPAAPSSTPHPTEAKLLLMGNWADPSILKDGDDYYMTHSSFEFQPGLLVWHSKDLRSWRPISRAVTNQPGSIWAPDLIKHDGGFYIYYPATGGNFVVTANSPHGPWSEPRSVGVGHIDPGHVVGPDGKRHLHLSGGCAVELSPDGLQAIGKPKHIYEGWPIPPGWAIECFCLESPKLTARGGWYYLTSAQGGTAGPATSHMVVSARSRHPLGPWENSPFNPYHRRWRLPEPTTTRSAAGIVCVRRCSRAAPAKLVSIPSPIAPSDNEATIGSPLTALRLAPRRNGSTGSGTRC